MTSSALLLTNLGSPDEPNKQAVRRYLDQFLMDPLVIQLPWIIRRLLVSLLVLPKRPQQSALAYQSIWTEKGSPLIVYSNQLKQAVEQQLSAQRINMPVFLAMRYGNPSIESQLLAIAKKGDINDILFAPLYPHYAQSTTDTSIKEAQRVIDQHQLSLKLSIQPPFYNQADYINALVEASAPYLFERSTTPAGKETNSPIPHLLFSYHGLPESHITKADVSGNHCLKSSDCCQQSSAAQQHCYRHQIFETTRLFCEKIGLTEQQYSVGFQSRLGQAKWLQPSTENQLQRLAKKGIKELSVICPAFVTDCLETLEEIGIRGKQTFLQAGGHSLRLIPCINDHPDWVKVIVQWCHRHQSTNEQNNDTAKMAN